MRNETEDYIRAIAPKLASSSLLDVLFAQPYCRIANLVDTGIAKRQTASEYLLRLVTIGVLRETKVGNEKLFLHTKLRQLLAGEVSHITTYKRNALAPDQYQFKAQR